MKKNCDSYINVICSSREELINALKILKSNKIRIEKIYSPVPLELAGEYILTRRSYLPEVGFTGGLLGAAVGFILQWWVAGAYPVQIGGKPSLPYLSFVPVVFECMVLGAFIAMVTAFLWRLKLGPGSRKHLPHRGVTDHEYMITIGVNPADPDSLRKKVSLLLDELKPVQIEHTLFI